jgi:hypothetical protein
MDCFGCHATVPAVEQSHIVLPVWIEPRDAGVATTVFVE